MFGYGFLVLALTALTTGTFILGLMFWGRLRIVRRVLWVVSGVLVFFAVGTPIQHYYNNKAESKPLVGTYFLDQVKSRYSPDSLKKYSDLTLIVREDNTFALSRVTPLFPAITGDWEFEDDGDLASLQCVFEGTKGKIQIGGGVGEWRFDSYDFIGGTVGETIVFTQAGYFKGTN